MKEYKVLEVHYQEAAEKLMNEMAKEGWEMVSMTYWERMFGSLLITFSREVQE